MDTLSFFPGREVRTLEAKYNLQQEKKMVAVQTGALSVPYYFKWVPAHRILSPLRCTPALKCSFGFALSSNSSCPASMLAVSIFILFCVCIFTIPWDSPQLFDLQTLLLFLLKFWLQNCIGFKWSAPILFPHKPCDYMYTVFSE